MSIASSGSAETLPGHPPVVALVGAGSRVFGFHMLTDICQTRALRGAEVRLVDTVASRLATTEKLFALLSQRTGMGLRILATTDRSVALRGADYVIIAAAQQRIERWETDLAISRRHGIVEMQGECGGPGGLSLTLRNVPMVLGIACDVARLAPQATVLNFSNPMLRVCLALSRYTPLRAVGLCHGLLGAQRFLSQLLGRAVQLKGCGINHFNWAFAARWADTGGDAWPSVLEALAGSRIPGWQYSCDLLKVFGRLPTVGDGHITDFVHHWRGARDGLNPAYDLQPKEMESYRQHAMEWEERMAGYVNGERNPLGDVDGLSGEGAIPIVAAMSGLIPPYDEIAVNLPNRGYIANLPEGAIVEVPAHVSAGLIEGERMGDLPAGIRSLILRQLEIAELAVEAAVEGSYSKALQALALDPIVPDLQTARSYLDAILSAHRDLLPRFAS